jgi:hypothetical protein
VRWFVADAITGKMVISGMRNTQFRNGVNMQLNLVWKKDTGKWQNGSSLYLNRIRIASFSYNIARERGDTNNSTTYSGQVLLPSLANAVKYGSTPEIIKGHIEQSVKAWFTEALQGGVKE